MKFDSLADETCTPDAATVDLRGRCVGSSYILVRPIGHGATGTVWRGVDRASGENVAVKLLRDDVVRRPKMVTRFVQERAILLRLRHEHIVRVRDLLSVGESLGLVMDLVPGGNLRDHLCDRGTLPTSEAARLLAQVAEALTEAHRMGVVHRDLKPDNILLQWTGDRPDTRLTDFGIARVLDAPGLTTAEVLVGTPSYMAPETIKGGRAGPATDVYALGVLLYELIVGRPPYAGPAPIGVLRAHIEDRPHRYPGIPEPAWAVIESCMDPNPNCRPASAHLVSTLHTLVRQTVGVPAMAPVNDEPELLHVPADRPERREALDRPAPGRGWTGFGQARPHAGWGGGGTGGAARALTGAGDGAGARAVANTGGQRAQGLRGQSRAPGVIRASVPGTGERMAASRAGQREPHPSLPLPPRRPKRPHNRPRTSRWGRPGAILALVAIGAALSSAVPHLNPWHLLDGGSPRAAPASHSAVPHHSGLVRNAAGAPLPHSTTRSPASPVASVGTSTGAGMGSRKAQLAAGVAVGGGWHCGDRAQWDPEHPVLAEPCYSIGATLSLLGRIQAPPGVETDVSLTLQDTASGTAVAGPYSCGQVKFADPGSEQTCGPFEVTAPRGHRYVLVQKWRYSGQSYLPGGTATGPAFTW